MLRLKIGKNYVFAGKLRRLVPRFINVIQSTLKATIDINHLNLKKRENVLHTKMLLRKRHCNQNKVNSVVVKFKMSTISWRKYGRRKKLFQKVCFSQNLQVLPQ